MVVDPGQDNAIDDTLRQAQIIGESWRRHDNTVPHMHPSVTELLR